MRRPASFRLRLAPLCRRARSWWFPLFLALLPLPWTGCGAVSGIGPATRAQMQAAIAQEPPGDYWIGRRYYNPYYKFWGYLRRPGQPWHSAQLVMLNEKSKLAPDREISQLGVDGGSEYKLTGRFTGETVYEPASNRFYPEFELRSYELLNRTPPPLWGGSASNDPTTVIQTPDPAL